MASKFVSMNMTPPARDAVQRMAVLVSAQVTRRVPMSPSLIAALQVAERHMDEVAAQLATNEQEGDNQ